MKDKYKPWIFSNKTDGQNDSLLGLQNNKRQKKILNWVIWLRVKEIRTTSHEFFFTRIDNHNNSLLGL